MTTEQVEELAGRLAESDLFICVTMKRGHSQEALYGETYKLIGVAFNTLLSAIDELETTEEQIAQVRTCIMFLNDARIAKEKAPDAAATAQGAEK
jgi:hypothetical protein